VQEEIQLKPDDTPHVAQLDGNTLSVDVDHAWLSTLIENNMPEEFKTGNDVLVERATIKRERMAEILKEFYLKYNHHINLRMEISTEELRENIYRMLEEFQKQDKPEIKGEQ